ncbi:hypothetical protein DKX38_006072 [Salix brachista]|uniref:Abscisic acid G-protein coupled receptor-like domain-containing protein n=1 Tax=Salix brachista TaxID=2182728 RepID=A0A5N5N0Y1_9ROSI|nr:hypothetical protein DKX38_006072 [Salix brachista]
MKRPLLLVGVFVLLLSWPSLPAFAILNSHSRSNGFQFYEIVVFPVENDYTGMTIRSHHIVGKDQNLFSSLRSNNIKLFGQRVARVGVDLHRDWSFLGGLTSSQIASSVFTLGTAAVLPFYTLMVVAPKAEVVYFLYLLGTSYVLSLFFIFQVTVSVPTRKSMESSIPYIVLGLLYASLLYLSWTPDTMRLMFASQYWLPELPGIAKMFSNEMTLASAWIHLLAVDLFAARQVFNDGLENEVETRHSVSLCLLFCPIGIGTHFITKALTKGAGTARHDM